MPKLSNTLVVLPYDPNWITEFERIRDYLKEEIGDLVIEIKHVGSSFVQMLAEHLLTAAFSYFRRNILSQKPLLPEQAGRGTKIKMYYITISWAT